MEQRKERERTERDTITEREDAPIAELDLDGVPDVDDDDAAGIPPDEGDKGEA